MLRRFNTNKIDKLLELRHVTWQASSLRDFCYLFLCFAGFRLHQALVVVSRSIRCTNRLIQGLAVVDFLTHASWLVQVCIENTFPFFVTFHFIAQGWKIKVTFEIKQSAISLNQTQGWFLGRFAGTANFCWLASLNNFWFCQTSRFKGFN